MLNLPLQSFKKVKNTLLRQKKDVEKDLKTLDKEDPLFEDGLAESTEPGTESWMADVHGRTQAVKHNLKDLLNKTKKALSNLKSEKYGKCEKCGQMIEPARLEAMPTAVLCISCSKKKS